MRKKLNLTEKIALLLMDKNKFNLKILEEHRNVKNIVGSLMLELINSGDIYIKDKILKVSEKINETRDYEDYVLEEVKKKDRSLKECLKFFSLKENYKNIVSMLEENIRNEFIVVENFEEGHKAFKVSEEAIEDIIEEVIHIIKTDRKLDENEISLMMYIYYSKIADHYLTKEMLKELKDKLNNYKGDLINNEIEKEAIRKTSKLGEEIEENIFSYKAADLIAYWTELIF